MTNINKEFHWKIYIELAQTYDRIGNQAKMIENLEDAILDCPESIKWKIWLLYSRI
jgi:hypothetical protein